MIPEIQVGDGRLLAVPAFHNRAVFAEAVHRACRDPATRPAAVAVELGPGTAEAAAVWLRELGAAREPAAPLPAMLGLVLRNRRIHPRHRAAALRLQEKFGLPLREIPVSVLRERLGFAGVSLCCLNAADSIVEAVRSGVELDLPVFGVDIESVATGDRHQSLLEDPVRAWPDLAAYVERNAPLGSAGGDPWVDRRREEAMAARLRGLLHRYETVLFTGGIGHWNRLRQLLADPMLKPTAAPPESGPEELMRVLVDPIMAVHHTDVFPEILPRYEALRNQPLDTRDPETLYRDIVREKLAAAAEFAQPSERGRLPGFARYLQRHALVNLRPTSDLFDFIQAAEVMVSRGFAERLGNELVAKSVAWAAPADWPELPLLRAEALAPGASAFAARGRKGRVVAPGYRSKSFYVGADFTEAAGGFRALIQPPPPWPEGGMDPEQKSGFPVWSWVWPPCEHLLFGAGYQAADIVAANARGGLAEPFAGSLHDGVDVKGTLRAFARGDQRVRVKNHPPEKSPAACETMNDPKVYLFSQGDDGGRASWEMLYAGNDLSPHVRDPVRYAEVARNRGSAFVAGVAFSEVRVPKENLRPWVTSERRLWGITVYGNPCVNAVQAARWVENSDYSGFPILRHGGTGELWSLFRERHGMEIDAGDWRTTLIRLAIPYARKQVLVIAPDDFPFPARIQAEARACGVRLELFPLSLFSEERVEAMRRQYFVPSRHGDDIFQVEGIEAALGESRHAHRELLPPSIRARIGDVEARKAT